jgi:hypothetical protein
MRKIGRNAKKDDILGLFVEANLRLYLKLNVANNSILSIIRILAERDVHHFKS